MCKLFGLYSENLFDFLDYIPKIRLIFWIRVLDWWRRNGSTSSSSRTRYPNAFGTINKGSQKKLEMSEKDVSGTLLEIYCYGILGIEKFLLPLQSQINY